MKGGFIFLFLIISITGINALNITSDAITGKPMANLMSMNITVTAPPALFLISPQNGTYLDKDEIPLDYSVIGEIDKVWYNLDSDKKNEPINSSIFFKSQDGAHILYIYANNSNGTTMKNVSFFVNSTKIKIKDEKWEEDKKGNSTDLKKFSYEQIQNLSNFTLEDTDYGKIHFNENVNLIDNENGTSNEIDLSSYVNISANRIEINSVALPNLNKSATLELYGLSFSNPKILRNGNLCPNTICTIESYSSGILRFNVTQFSVYSSEETFSGSPIVSNAQNEARDSCNYDWICSDWYPQPCPQEGIQKKLCVNRGTCSGEWGTPAENRTCIPGVSSPAEPLFDVSVSIPLQYKWTTSKNDLKFNVKLVNVGNSTTIDVYIKYWITDKNNQLILEKDETKAVSKEDEFTVKTALPENLKPGISKVYVEINYDKNRTALAEDSFEIVNSGLDVILGQTGFFLPFVLGAFIPILVLLILLAIKRKDLLNFLENKHK